jgi:hypothetical protein
MAISAAHGGAGVTNLLPQISQVTPGFSKYIRNTVPGFNMDSLEYIIRSFVPRVPRRLGPVARRAIPRPLDNIEREKKVTLRSKP